MRYSHEAVRRLQKALSERGFVRPSPIDGVVPRTREALRAFQEQQKITAGRFDRDTAVALGLSDFDDNTVSAIDMSSTPGSGGQYAGPEYRGAGAPNVVGDTNPIRRDVAGSAGSSNFGVRSGDNVRELQRALRASGFDPGPLDGVFGPQTRSALMQYQRKNKLSATGRPDRDTVAALGWPQLRDFDDNKVGTIDMSSTPGSGGEYAGPSRRSPGSGGR